MRDDTMASELHDHSLADLTKRLSRDVSELVRKEIELARAEMGAKSRRLAAGAAMLALAATFGLVTLAVLTATAVLALATAMSAWLAALVVAAGAGLLAAIALGAGARALRRAAPPAPTDTLDAVKEDVAWVRTRARSGAR
jgi:uncharacterized membrane protein YqjE